MTEEKEFKTDESGKWEKTGKHSWVLREPSTEYLAGLEKTRIDSKVLSREIKIEEEITRLSREEYRKQAIQNLEVKGEIE